MKKIKNLLKFTLFFTTVIAIMLAPAMIMATCFELSPTMFLILLTPCSVFGFILGFKAMAFGLDNKIIEDDLF